MALPMNRRTLIASGVMLATSPNPGAKATPTPSGAIPSHGQDAYRLRVAAAESLRNGPWPDPEPNGDESLYSDKRASFSKTLPHNDLGEVDPSAFAAFVITLKQGSADDFERLPRAKEAVERLNDPQAMSAFGLSGADSTSVQLPPPPRFASPEMAAEMGELYWLALLADVPFRRIEADALAEAAARDLSAFSGARVFGDVGSVTPSMLFRGDAAGDRPGPIISQFLWMDIPFGNKVVDQRYSFPTASQAFLIEWEEWLACQRGAAPSGVLRFDEAPRYIASGRDLAEFVRRDFSFQTYMNAALIMLRLAARHGNDVLSSTNPYRHSRTQFGDITFGGKDVLTAIAEASLCAQKASYYQKWLAHRRLRPEAYGGRLETHARGGKRYDFHPDLMNCVGVARSDARFGARLLPIAYPGGSPTHPSYPAAHAYNGGACAAVLKAFFNPDFVIPEPVQATDDGGSLEAWAGEPLTLGHEIDKLASNIAFGRDAARVHYRSDSANGLRAGESIGIALLCDRSVLYRERFDGFVLRRRDGTTITIRDGAVL
jgi:hypothetical protein